MGMRNCPKYNICNAPICPLSKAATKRGVWYADEEICSRPIIRRKYKWTSIQMRIKRKTNGNRGIGLFTVEMLLRIRSIGKGITGVKDLKLRKAWLEKHPPIVELTEEQVAKRRERLLKLAEVGRKSRV